MTTLITAAKETYSVEYALCGNKKSQIENRTHFGARSTLGYAVRAIPFAFGS